MSTAPSSLQDRVRQTYARLSPSHRRVVDYLLSNTTTAVFLTSDQVASQTGTSASTVIRCATQLGYRGYPDLRRELQLVVTDSLRPADRLERGRPDAADIAQRSVQMDVGTLQDLAHHLDQSRVARAADLLEQAQRVFVRGARSSWSVSWFIGLVLSQIRAGVTMLNTIETVFEDVGEVMREDLLVVVALPRYTGSTVELARFFHARQAGVISVTDSAHSPLAEYSTVLLSVPYESASFFNSNVAAMALANALLATIAGRRRDEIRERLEHGEAVWRQFRTHYSAVPGQGG
jgi:DNA-binding MurR/RpiR family transcriptional regulator